MSFFARNLPGEWRLSRALVLAPNTASPFRFARIRNLSGVAITLPFTLQGWYKIDGATIEDNGLFSTYSSTTTYTDLRILPGGTAGTWRLTGASRSSSGAGAGSIIGAEQPGATYNDWHHVALVVNAAGAAVLYLDGVQTSSLSTYGTLLPASFWPIVALGSRNGNNLASLKGKLARWSWLTHALAADDIRRIYNAGRGSDYLTTRFGASAFLFRLPLDDAAIAVGQPAVLLDVSGNSRHADLFPNSTGTINTAGNVTASTPQVANL